MLRESGLSPRAWISRERLRYVAHRLSSSDVGILLAETCGYRSYSFCAHLLLQQFRAAPNEWRQQADPRKAARNHSLS